MNKSGNTVGKFVRSTKAAKDLIVVHDDLDIPLGKFKIQKGVGPLLHNGIESIENSLAGKDFWRVRIGIDNRKPNTWIDGETYVLQDFQPEEKKIVSELFPSIFVRLKNDFLLNNLSA